MGETTPSHSFVSGKNVRTVNSKPVFLLGTVVLVLFSSAAYLLDFEGMGDDWEEPTHGPHNIVTGS